MNLTLYNKLFSDIRIETSTELEDLPKLGAAVDMNICGNLSAQDLSINTNEIDTILFLYNILNFNSQYHELDETNRIETHKWYQKCQTTLNFLKSQQNYTGKAAYYTTTNGCNLRSSDPYQVYKQAVFVDTISSFADTLKLPMFISPAFVPAWDANISVLNRPILQPGEYYDCGWWQVSQKNGSGGEYVFENKFELTRRIYGHLKELPEDILLQTSLEEYFPWWLIVLSVALVFIVTTILFAILVIRYRSKYILHKRELEEFFNGGQSTIDDVALNGSDAAARLKYNKELYEIPPSSFNIDETRCLGTGAFGVVYAGVIEINEQRIEVAVKLTKKSGVASTQDAVLSLRGLISEIKILSYVGKHEHIVRLHGAYTAKLRTGYLLVFLEFCELGSLEKYLRCIKINETKNAEEGKSTLTDCANSVSRDVFDQLYQWCKEIADGMDYLSAKKIVHADLATRNVLLNSAKTAKIADFGLSRRLYDYTNYVKKQQEPLPWRWMAPESLKRMEFSVKSDIWSYAITLWEIYTFGDVPYPGAVWDAKFLEDLEAGLVPQSPKYEERSVYTNVMLQCWEINPDKRPPFAQLKQVFEKSIYDIVL